jgi:hypothetical protein
MPNWYVFSSIQQKLIEPVQPGDTTLPFFMRKQKQTATPVWASAVSVQEIKSRRHL